MKKIKTIKVKNCKIKLNHQEDNCYLYNFDKLGITPKQLQQSLEGGKLIVYKDDDKPLSRTLRKCIYCGIKTDNYKKHLKKKHNRTIKDFKLARFQLKLYKELLQVIRKKGTIFAFIFTIRSCKLCDNASVEGREDLCALPESARNKVRSLQSLGFDCDGFNQKWFDSKKRYGFIIYKKPTQKPIKIPNR